MKRNSASKSDPMRIKRSYMHILLMVTAFLLTGSAALPQSDEEGDISLRNRKLNLLEKLEKGIPVESGEIFSSFARKNDDAREFAPFGEEFENLFENIREDMAKVHDQLGRIRESREFEKAMESFRREREQFRQEIERLRDEMRRLRFELVF